MVELHQPGVGQHVELATYGRVGQQSRDGQQDYKQLPSSPCSPDGHRKGHTPLVVSSSGGLSSRQLEGHRRSVDAAAAAAALVSSCSEFQSPGVRCRRRGWKQWSPRNEDWEPIASPVVCLMLSCSLEDFVAEEDCFVLCQF